MEIKTNNQWRPVLSWFELTDKERAEFDYIDSQDARESAAFFRYKGHLYDIGEFTVAPRDIGGDWHGCTADSFFSGVLIQLDSDGESVKVATYYC